MKRKIFPIIAAITLTAASVFPASAAPVRDSFLRPACGIFCTRQETMSRQEQEAARLVNVRRAENGLAPLTVSEELSVKARVKSTDMLEKDYFSHNSPTYGSPFALMKVLGIEYRSAAENIAMGYSTAEAVVNAWMNSPGHRANILSSHYTSMGIGHTDGYWTQWFIG